MQTAISTKSFLILIISVLIIFSCSTTEDVDPDMQNGGQQQNGDSSREAAPDFELTALDGTSFKMSEQSDKVVVLFFIGSTCPSCLAVAPEVEKELNAAYAGKTDYVIVGLDQWDGANSAVQSFKNLTNVSFPLLLNASGVPSSFKTTYDRLIIVDKEGNIAHKGARAAANDINTVTSTVDDLLKNM